MSGSTFFGQNAAADVSATRAMQILPGTLANGLVGHFLFNGSLALALTNLAPGGTQGATVVGAPTMGSGFINLTTAVNYVNSGLLETAALTMIITEQTDDTLATLSMFLAANATTDAAQGSGVVGTQFYYFNPNLNTINASTYYGANFAGKAVLTRTVAATGSANNWNTVAVTIQGVSPWLFKVRNLTTGVNGSLNGANPRQINTTQPFLLGQQVGKVTAGAAFKMASFSLWNRDLSDTECSNMRTLVLAPYLSAKFGITV